MTSAQSDAKRATARKRARWVIYPSLIVIVALLFGVCALSYMGTFSHLRNRTITPQERQADVRLSRTSGIPAAPSASPKAYATPQAYAAWWRAVRGGDRQRQVQMQRAGRVVTLPAGTPIWYQPLTGSAGLTPVRLLGSRYAGRTYWVQGNYLGSQHQAT